MTNDVVPMPTMNAVRKRAAAAPARAVARAQLTEREAIDLTIASAVRRGILPNKTRKGRRAGVLFAETSPRARRRRPSVR